jgi:3-hydroxypropanoate dehydrogenase
MAIEQSALNSLFVEARTHNKWTENTISDSQLTDLYDLFKFGPTSANCSPGRFLFVRSRESKEKLLPFLSSGNREKTSSAPVTVIVAYDPKFYDKLPFLFPHTDARPWFTGNEKLSYETAFRNSTLQGAYLMFAARALGWDVGPMSGFDSDAVDQSFLAHLGWKSNFLINLGFGDPSGVLERLPRLPFDEACRVL